MRLPRRFGPQGVRHSLRYWRFTDKARTPGHRFGIPKRTPRNAIADTPPQKEL
ncbi:MAG: hypothetical protein ACLSHC_06325 [Bilophila wadsworthia]